jgi:hypothetical protein
MRYRGFFLCEVVVVLAVLSVALRYIMVVDFSLSQRADRLLAETVEVVGLAR